MTDAPTNPAKNPYSSEVVIARWSAWVWTFVWIAVTGLWILGLSPAAWWQHLLFLLFALLLQKGFYETERKAVKEFEQYELRVRRLL